MAGDIESRDEGWADWVAHRTFLYTIVGAALFFAAVFVFVLRH